MLRKIITTATLVAASTALSSAAVVLSQALTDSSNNTSDLWSLVEGKTYSAAATSGIADFDRYTASTSFITQSGVDLSKLYGYSDSGLAGNAFQITTFSLMGPDSSDSNKTGGPGTTTGKITIAGTYKGTSISYESGDVDDSAYNGTYTSYQERKFSFTDAKFDAGSEITISGSGSNYGYAVVQTSDGYTISETTANSQSWNPVYKLTVTAIPEPSAFGLLAGIGALAFAVSRRKRR